MKSAAFVLAFQLGLALSVTYENQRILVPLALLPVLLIEPRVLGILLRWKLLAFLAVMVVGIPLVAGARAEAFMGVPYSSEYVRISIVMGYRSVIILLALHLFTRRISLPELAERVRTTRFRRFGEAFALAMELLPPLRDTTLRTYREYRRSIPRRGIAGHTRTWTTELIARALVDAERTYIIIEEREHAS